MYHRLINSIVVTVALFVVSPLFGDDEKAEPPAPVPEAETAAEPAPDGDEGKPDSAESKADSGGDDDAADKKSVDAHENPAKSDDAGHSTDHAGGGAGHAVDHDLSHANPGPKLASPDDFRADLAIWTFVVFICLLAVLGKFAWGPIMDGLEKREESIKSMIDEAKQSSEKAAEQLKQYEEKLAAAGEEARDIVTQARKDAEAAGERIVAEAQAAAGKERERAVSDIVNAKRAALDEIQSQGVSIAVQLAGQIVRRELNSQDHTQLINEALEQLPSRN